MEGPNDIPPENDNAEINDEEAKLAEPEPGQPGVPEEQKEMFQDEDDYLTADHVLKFDFEC